MTEAEETASRNLGAQGTAATAPNSTDLPSSTPADSWDRIIRAHRKWFDLKLGELWRYRDLVMLFVRRDFVSLYKQTILGPLWYLIQPLLTTITFAAAVATGQA